MRVQGNIEEVEPEVEIEHGPSIPQDLELDPKIKEQVEYILYDEALRRAGGFGLYQYILFFSVSILVNYGQQMIYNFGFLTNPLQYECSNTEDVWYPCYSEEICSSDFQGQHRPDESHKDYINGFMSQLDMVCYSKKSIAFMAQIYFIGFSSRIVFIPLPQKIGLVTFLKFCVIPLNILSYTLSYQSQSYSWRCFGFFLAGVMRIKVVPSLLILKDQSESKYHSYAGTVTYGLDAMTLTVFCVYLQTVSRNAISYLHFVNGIGILCMFMIELVVVESPNHLIQKGQYKEAKKALNKIAKVNGLLKSQSNAYEFNENVKIFMTKQDMTEYQKNNLLLQSTNGSIALEMRQIDKNFEEIISEAPETDNSQKQGFFQIIVLLIKNHNKVFALLLLARIYVNSMWYTNLYDIQKNNLSSSDAPSIFWNGIYFSTVDATALVVGGYIGKKYMVFNAFLLQIAISAIFVFAKLVAYISGARNLNILSYLLVFSTGIQFNLYFLGHMRSLPDKLHFVSLETASSISALAVQIIPSIILMDSPIPQIFQMGYIGYGAVVFALLRHFYKKKVAQEIAVENLFKNISLKMAQKFAKDQAKNAKLSDKDCKQQNAKVLTQS